MELHLSMQSVAITTNVVSYIPLVRRVFHTLCDKVCQWLATCWWFSPGTPVSSNNKSDRQAIIEILLKVALDTIILILIQLDNHSSSFKIWKLNCVVWNIIIHWYQMCARCSYIILFFFYLIWHLDIHKKKMLLNSVLFLKTVTVILWKCCFAFNYALYAETRHA
jgi:hypothetical protein